MKSYLRTLGIASVAALIAGAVVVKAAQSNFLGVVFIADPTTVTQQMKVNSDGSINVDGGSAAAPITPIVSTSAENSHVLKASAGTVYGVYASNLTSTAGFLLLLNSTSAPADGAVTPLACVALAATGGQPAVINYNPGPAATYSTGIVAVLSSAATCFTKTTGTITGFISGAVQ